ncbi:MAG TPA: hypothetical protein PKN22_07900 [Taishania sp.]|nr:hypothetical protein [Taishania sp.]
MSLLPIVEIAEFIEKPLTGGTTRPMMIIGNDGKQYVLKIFSKTDAKQRSYTVAEAVANILAKEFDLVVPNGIYTKIDHLTIKKIEQSQPTLFKLLEEKETDKLLFASHFQEGCPIFSPAIKHKSLEISEMETILAFDMLIANDDRRKDKPNILKGKEHYILIDHEKCFEGLAIHLENMNKGILPHFFKNHLFYTRLNKFAKKSKNNVNFATFEEYFRNLNLEKVCTNVHFLIENGYNEDECNNWLHYLHTQKENCHKFVALLKHKIRE